MAKHYSIVECFRSIQGEGARAGTVNVFIRFAGCNLTCDLLTDGFACDTDFSGGRKLTLDELLIEVINLAGDCRWVILTGGEPALQIDEALIKCLEGNGFKIAIETNGTVYLPPGIDWICVSPKTAQHTIKATCINELKFVMHEGQSLPKPSIKADHYLLSPAFQPDGKVKKADLDWCVKLCNENPQWRLSLQLHKFLGVR